IIISDTGVSTQKQTSLPTHLVNLNNAASTKSISILVETLEAISMALRSLKENWFRTLLTLLGIVIGVGSVVAMLAVGSSAKDEWSARVSYEERNVWALGAGGERGGGRDAVGMASAVTDRDARDWAMSQHVEADMTQPSTGQTARAIELATTKQVTVTSA